MITVDSLLESAKYQVNPPRGTIHRDTVQLSDGCMVIIIKDFLEGQFLDEYVEKSCTVERKRGISAYGVEKPRFEISYTVDGSPNVYSGVKHYTTVYADHVLELAEKIQTVIELYYGAEVSISTAIDILYSRYISGSGSIGKHSDDEQNWCAVAIYSLGQTRHLVVKSKEGSESYIIEMSHNSLVVMLDSPDSEPGQFQRNYTHQVNKLTKSTKLLGDRLSLNVRYSRREN